MTASADRTKRHMSRRSYTTTGGMTLASGEESFNDDVVGADKEAATTFSYRRGQRAFQRMGDRVHPTSEEYLPRHAWDLFQIPPVDPRAT